MDYSKMTREELRQVILKDRSNTQAFEAYMDMVNGDAVVKTLIPDDIAADPEKLAAFLSRNK